MHVSRELALTELRETVCILNRWIDELENPRVVGKDGNEIMAYPHGVPPMLAIAEMSTISIPIFRAELAVAASKLEAIAST